MKLIGEIGMDIMAQDVRAGLEKAGDEVEIYIDSVGGDVIESNAISLAIAEYALAHPNAKYTCVLGSLCASAAANIVAKLPSCFVVKAYKDTLIMFHSCSALIQGSPKALKDYSVMMQLVNEAVIRALISKTTLDPNVIKSAFESGELWLGGEDALRCGLVSELIDANPETVNFEANARTQRVLALVAKYRTQHMEAKMAEENKPTQAEEAAQVTTAETNAEVTAEATPTATAEENKVEKTEIETEVEKEENEPPAETDWQAECDKLKAENEGLKKEIESLKSLVAKYQPSAKPTSAAPKADWLSMLRELNSKHLPEAEYAKEYTALKAAHKQEFDAFMQTHTAR